MTNSALLMSSLLFVSACERAQQQQQQRLFTDRDLADLETRVIAEVNRSRSDCIRPEAVALWKPTAELAACINECDVLDYGADHKKPIRRDELLRIATPEAAALDAKCGALISSAFERAAANRGCSPFQLGIDNDESDAPTIIRQRLHLIHLLARHASSATDRASGARSLVAGLQASQDLAHGRTISFTLITESALRSSLAQTLLELLADAQLTRNDLDAFATSIDQLIASEPAPHDILQTEEAYVGFAYGLVPLQGASWRVPGGRNASMTSGLRPSNTHDPRDDAGVTMLTTLEHAARLRTMCEPAASYRLCFDHINAIPRTTTVASDVNLLDRPRDDTEATRVRIKRDLVENYMASASDIDSIIRRVKVIVPLIAVRLRIEVLRNGRCPTVAELDAPPYSILRAPRVLGDSIQLTPIDQGLRLDVPSWARDWTERDLAKLPSPPPRPSKVISVPCP